MSTAANPYHLPANPPVWEQWQRRALIAAGAGTFLCVVGALLNLEHFFRAYLVAYLFFLGIALGGMVLVMLQHLSGGAWGLLARRPLESATRTLPLLALLFLPVAAGVLLPREGDRPWIYPWAQPGWVAAYRAEPGSNDFDKADYFNGMFFVGRAVAYFAIWVGLAFYLNRWSRQEDVNSHPGARSFLRKFSAPGLIVYGLTITLASIDWVMSLQPEWYSTIYGVLFAVGQILNALAFAIAVLVLLSWKGPLQGLVAPCHLRDLGNLMLAFTLLWVYMAFSQFLLIWSGNLAEEIPYYLRRSQGGWWYVTAALALLGFVLPFLLLLSRDVKRRPGRLALVAGLVMVARVLDLFWQVMPAFAEEDLTWRWLWIELAALVALGGLWSAWFLRQLGQRPLLPVGDPYLPEVIGHHE